MGAGGSVGTGHSLGSEPHSAAVWPWENHLTSLSPGFLICEMGGWSREEDGGGRGSLVVSGRLSPSGIKVTRIQAVGPDKAPPHPRTRRRHSHNPPRPCWEAAPPPPGPALTPG